MLFIILYYPPDPPTSRAPEAMTILHSHLRVLSSSWFWSRKRVGSSLLLLLCSYSNSLSIFQIGYQELDRSLRWITSLFWFYHLSSWQSRSLRLSKSSLDSPLFRSLTIERDWLPIEDQWKEANIDVLRVDSLTASSQPSSCRFTHGPSSNQEVLSFNYRIGKALALLWVNMQARSLIKLL